MKKIFSIVLAGCLMLTITSCNDFLTEEPTTSVPDDAAFNTAQDYINALNGVYYTLGTYRFLGRDVLAVGDAAADLTAHSAATSHFYDIYSYQILETNAYLEEIWRYGYAAIDRSARIIHAGTSATGLTPSDMLTVDQCIAQAYGTRALSTFILTNIFGLPYSEQNKSSLGIVNVEAPIAAFEQVQRVSVEDNYKFILSDIVKAKEFYAKEGVEDVGNFYMNKAAVSALEARVRLYMKDYEGAINAAKQAIELRKGSIVSTTDDYKKMFKELTISSEDIFVIAKSETDYLSANALSTLYGTYGLSVNPNTIAEYAADDIRLSLLSGDWAGGKMGGITSNDQIQNLPVLRLPELYLTMAEAYAATGNYSAAKESLLEVAAKRNPSLDAASIKEDATIIPVIAKERKLELCQEGHRFFDARRLNEVINVTNGSNKNFDIAKFVYPIPSKEVNSGFGVVQTTGWDANLPK
ncbi:RagB/SusD family nutrient uptake outer membrane protein [Parabacteroides bouchesdurhonensis]|uniref:RagB/SusD family nutrient uptake outer membrane protein n=1 Tax=Parabacteroides bouchesdurhonensis TaxID=1936995 RepID=UPI000C8576A3|nr:RagB/SusD family nutrient uptake outer membrane protein [Parabacteroides bouchesdurhonensis]